MIDLMLRRPWFNLPTHAEGPLRALYLQNENSARRMNREIPLIRSTLTPEEQGIVNANMLMQVPLKMVDLTVSTADPDSIRRMRRAIEKFRPDIIVIDPMRKFSGATDENKSVEMIKVIKTLHGLAMTSNPECTLIIVHHSRVGREAILGSAGWDKGAVGVGSKALHDYVRSQITVMPGAENDATKLVIISSKNNDGAHFDPFGVQLDPETMTYEPWPEFDFDEWRKSLSPRASRRRKQSDEQVDLETAREALGAEPLYYKDAVNALREALNIGKNAAESTLRDLKDRNLVSVARVGKRAFYQVNDPTDEDAEAADDLPF
jgi:DNA-binding transcriptional ArsR family regulator